MITRFAKRLSLCSLLFCICGLVNADEVVDGHFTSWENVPKLIDSISKENYRKPLEHLRKTTRIKLGYPQGLVGQKEFDLYLIQTKDRWQTWWKTTGKPVMDLKKRDANVDKEAMTLAWKFLGDQFDKPTEILPVWIPKTWTLCVTFTNGDYMGREKEIWMIDRQENSVNFTKLRGDYSKGQWSVSLTRFDGFTRDQADRALKALCYLHRYTPAEVGLDSKNELKLYYPSSSLSLRDGEGRILWNVNGYDFNKSRDDRGEGESGRTYYFLHSMFGDKRRWSDFTEPSSAILAPYRDFLASGKPYFSSLASEVVLLLGQYGGELERKSLLDWAEKQKAAIDPDMGWEIWCGDFSTSLKINVINFTRNKFQTTVKEIKRLGERLELTEKQVKENEALGQNNSEMLALVKKEKEADIMRHPQPLRDLIRTDRHPSDPDLKHLKLTIEHIRKNPDPNLFKQLAAELDDGTVEMRMLLEHVLLDERGFLGVKPWGVKEEAIAINACIDALPIADGIGETEDLITILLKACGGGKIVYQGKKSSRSIEITLNKDGYSATYSGADNPLSIKNTQKKLRRIYAESKKKK